MNFLTAEWRKLLMANYVIDPDLLKDDLPPGTEIDLWQGKCYVSLVGFMFLKTRILGVKIPWHSDFEEANLRFYVRRKVDGQWRRGVVFIKEIVPRSAITLVANTIYKENYQTMSMKHIWSSDDYSQTVSYQWKHKDSWQTMKVEAEKNAVPIEPESEEEFITEHYWGYAKASNIKTNEYEVMHPKWECCPVKSHLIDVKYGDVYGLRFQFLEQEPVTSIILTEGSAIAVKQKNTLLIK